MWVQRPIRMTARPRGFHLITGEVVAALPELEGVSAGDFESWSGRRRHPHPDRNLLGR